MARPYKERVKVFPCGNCDGGVEKRTREYIEPRAGWGNNLEEQSGEITTTYGCTKNKDNCATLNLYKMIEEIEKGN